MGVVIALRTGEVVSIERSDAELLEAVARADREALGALFDRFHRDVFACAARILGSHGPELDDVVQDTFVQVQRAARGFAGRSSVRTWILGVAANVARISRRASARRASAHERFGEAIDAPPGADPPERVEHARLMRRLADALDQLPEAPRIAFVLCVLEGASTKDAAGVLDVPEGTVSRRVHEARRALSAILGRA